MTGHALRVSCDLHVHDAALEIVIIRFDAFHKGATEFMDLFP